MAINSPYVPGDPYSYDLKWIVKRLKNLQGLDYEEITDLIDWDNSDIDSSGVTVYAYRSGHEVYFYIRSMVIDATHYNLAFKAPYNSFYCAEIFPLLTGSSLGSPLDTVVGYYMPSSGAVSFTNAGTPTYRCGFTGHFTLK